MKVQVDTTRYLELEVGDKLDIRGTGINIGGTEDPALDVVYHGPVVRKSMNIFPLPTTDNTLEHLSTGKDLLDAEPRLKNLDETITGVVVGIEVSGEYYNTYSVEVVTSAEVKKSTKESKVDNQ